MSVKWYCSDSEIAGRQMFKKHASDAGFDICAASGVTVPARGVAKVDTCLHVAIPENFVGIVSPRSGNMFNKGINVFPGVIDSEYRGSIAVMLMNTGDEPVTFSKGDRVAQLVVMPCLVQSCREDSLESLGATNRGDKGFGSTGA